MSSRSTRSLNSDKYSFHKGSRSSVKSSISSLNERECASVRRESTRSQIGRLERARAERRLKAEQARILKAQEEKKNIANGNPGDIDFQRLIAQFRKERNEFAQEHTLENLNICVAVRKRPINAREVRRKDHDSVTVFNPQVIVHNCKLKVDGITKYLDSNEFQFDHSFDENSTTSEVYYYTARPLIPFVLHNGRATVFAYGQTGSGKTYTMMGIQQQAIDDLFKMIEESPSHYSNYMVYVSFFEIYGGHCQDLLNSQKRLDVREDGQGDVHIAGLSRYEATSSNKLRDLVNRGNSNRTTHATESNDTSSRSHAICQISLIDADTNRLHGKLSLIDLAGSERGADTNSNNRQRRMEGAEINKSLLALKECIRALDAGESHVPYRGSKLTLILKDSFSKKNSKTVMIATVSPGASHAEHTINTLRYADRVKETKVIRRPSKDKPEAFQNDAVATESPIVSSDEIEDSPVDDDTTSVIDSLSHNCEPINEQINVINSGNENRFTLEQRSAFMRLHMSIVKESAELLKSESRMLEKMEGPIGDDEYHKYLKRLEKILERKSAINAALRLQLSKLCGSISNLSDVNLCVVEGMQL